MKLTPTRRFRIRVRNWLRAFALLPVMALAAAGAWLTAEEDRDDE